jgi:hypothetical protein
MDTTSTALAAVLCVLVVLGAIVGYLVRRSTANVAADPARALYGELEAVLRARGWPRPPERTPLAHVELLEREGVDCAGVARRVTERYVEARFAGKSLLPEEVAVLAFEVRRLRRQR